MDQVTTLTCKPSSYVVNHKDYGYVQTNMSASTRFSLRLVQASPAQVKHSYKYLYKHITQRMSVEKLQ